MEVTDKSVSAALDYLASTDESCAKARALVEFLAESRKTVKADMYLSSGGSTSVEKEQMAYASKDYKEHLNKHRDAVLDYELQKNKRERARLTIEVWRTKQANQRMGNI